MISAHSNTQTLFGPAAFTPDYSHIAVPKPNFNLAISSTPHESTTKTRLPADANPLGFEDLLAAADLPPPGPLHYAARRDLWLRAKTAAPPRKPEPSTSRKRLETLLNSPDAANKEEVWKGGVEKVWKGLNAGGRLKRRLPMNLVVSTRLELFMLQPYSSDATDTNITLCMGQRSYLACGCHCT